MHTKPARSLSESYQWCRKLAKNHYENFPVASWLLPRELRDPISAIYAFARIADDICDEGNAVAAQRARQLHNMADRLASISAGKPQTEPLYIALADCIHRYHLPSALFHDLLDAFAQDLWKTRYQSFDEILDYCRRSANPIGRLLLHLQRQDTEENLLRSDDLCTALQLINFLQDIKEDFQNNDRIYIPMDEMTVSGADEQGIIASQSTPAWKLLIQQQLNRAADRLRSGSLLANALRGRFAIEVNAIALAGNRMLEKLSSQNNVFDRPKLNRSEHLGIMLSALVRSSYRNHNIR